MVKLGMMCRAYKDVRIVTVVVINTDSHRQQKETTGQVGLATFAG